MNNGLRLCSAMDKNFKQILSALNELPDLSELGNLKLFHLIILKLIQKSNSIPVKNIISHPELTHISQSQRYRYINDLIDQKMIKLQSKGVLTLA